ncbi:peptidoglycan-binding protein [Streptomyces caelestis]|uniref:peptidoglycan-binding domain-containing protein n=1 Tax=Streptomyces caelestis TaxID=36816 RepID=UPI003666D2BD
MAVSVAMLGSGLLGVATATPASAATPTCDWVGSYAGAWVPMHRGTSTVNCNMVQGTNSPAVQKLQYSMNLCYGENLSLDGDFGPATKAALIRTQRKAGTPADGQYGPNTRTAMYHQAINGGCTRVP